MSEAIQADTTAVVASILDGGLRVVINKGRNAGIERGDQFLVFHRGPEIIDPETKESLGTLELLRGRGKITQVEDKFSVLESLETRGKPRVIAGITMTVDREFAPFEKVEIKDLVKPV